MALIRPESNDWLDQISVLEDLINKNSSITREDQKKALNLKDSQITNLKSIMACFDKAARDRVRQAALAKPPYILSFSNAVTLARLKGRIPNLSKTVNEVLDVVFERQFATKEIRALVIWVINGNSAKTFDPENIAPEVTPTPKLKATESTTSKPATAPSSEPIDQDQAEEGNDAPVRRSHTEARGVVVPIPDEGIGKEDTDTEVEPIQPSASLKTGNSNKTKVSGNSSSKADVVIPKFIINIFMTPILFVWHAFVQALKIIGKYFQKFLVGFFVVLILIGILYAVIWVGYERLYKQHSFHWCFETMVSSVTSTNDEPKTAEVAKPVTSVAVAPTVQPQVKVQPTVPPPAKVKAKQQPTKKVIYATDETTKLALDFVSNYYGVSYKNLDDMMDYFHKWLNDSYEDTFMDKVLPNDRRHEIKDQKLVLSFKPTQPVKYLKEGSTWDEVLVQGTLTTRCEKEEGTVTVTTESVSLAIGVMHTGNSDGPICEVREVE